jgi:hypothetical protein
MIRVTNRKRTARLELLVEPSTMSCPVAALDRGRIFFDYEASRLFPEPPANAARQR